MSVAFELREAMGQNRRFAVHVPGGTVEAVIYRGDSVCISSQVGCAVACPFCASGANGFSRNLSLEELIGQVEAAQGDTPAIRRVTLSGVGEPLHNGATTELLKWCQRRRLSLSLTTSGGPVSRLAEWLIAPHRGLTISVHAGTEGVRRRMVPRGPSLGDLFATVEATAPHMNRTRRKRTALAYLLVPGENDSEEELDAFASRARVTGFTIHLYALNPVASAPYRPLTRDTYERAYRYLANRGLSVRMSATARLEANGGCGTLVAEATSGSAKEPSGVARVTREPRKKTWSASAP